MRYLRNVQVFAAALLGGLVVLAAGGAARAADDWGTIKGRVVYGGEKPPAPVALNVDKDQKACLEKNPKLFAEDWAMDPKTKGMKWAIVWLVPANANNNAALTQPIPIHPDLKGRKLKNVEIDQPCCMFEPYCVALQAGQSITIKNSMAIPHNSKVDGDSEVGNPQKNPLIPGGGSVDIGPFKSAQWTEIPLSCSIHSWMGGHIRVFSHPYYVVTNQADGKFGEFEIKDAPAGKYRLVIWQPGVGWVTGDKGKDPSKFGVVIEIKKDATTDLGDFKVKPPTEEKK